MIANCKASVTVSASAPVKKLCPFADEVDYGHVRIIWTTDDDTTIEAHALRGWLRTWADQKVSHEDFTESVYLYLLTQMPSMTSVSSEWVTAGMTVTVTAP